MLFSLAVKLKREGFAGSSHQSPHGVDLEEWELN